MYDELIKRLREKAGAFDYDGRPDIACDYEQAADAIEELMRRCEQFQYMPPPAWIPVTERLPKMIDGETISKDVYVTDGTEIAKACIMRDYDGIAGWTYTGIGKITHWCERIPLPQPPKEET